TVADQEKLRSFFALAEDLLSSLETHIGSATGQQLLGIAAPGRRKRDVPLQFAQVFPWSFSPAEAVAPRMAPTSSVMSMPTGHQVMQRPQPTHPELPNWSIQDASLWVIHCR